MKALVFGLVSCVCVGACGNHLSDDIAARYNARVRQLDLTPVYPPREEVQVGDLFLNSEHPGSDEHAVHQFVMTMPDVLGLAQQNLDGRVAFVKSKEGADNKISNDSVGQQDDLEGGRIATRRGGAINALPLAVFPEITAYAGADFSAGILAPLQALGLFAGGRTTVKLGFNDVRTYFAPQLQAYGLGLREVCRRLSPKGTTFELQYVKNEAARVDKNKFGPLAPSVASVRPRHEFYRLITRVYLTRSITYTYRNARLLALARQPVKASANTTFPTTIVAVNTATQATPPVTTGAAADIGTIMTDLNKQTASVNEGERFVSFSALGLTIERVFARPVAVAYEGIEFDTDWVGLQCNEIGAPGALAHVSPGTGPTSTTSSHR